MNFLKQINSVFKEKENKILNQRIFIGNQR